MRRLDMRIGAKGMGAGIVCAMLLTAFAALRPLCSLTVYPQNLILPLLSVWTGPASSLVCAVASALAAGSMLSKPMALWMLARAVPGLIGAWLIHQPLKYHKKMAFFVGLCTLSGLGWALYEYLASGGRLVEELAKTYTEGNYGGAGIYIPGICGYFSTTGMLEMLQYDRSLDEFGTLAWMMRTQMRENLPGSICAWSIFTGILACALPMRILARHGEVDTETYIPIEKWVVPFRWLMGMSAVTAAMLVWTTSGSETAAGAAKVFMKLTSLMLAVHGAAGICSRLKRMDVPRGRRIGLVIVLGLMGGILQLAGAWRFMFGSGGIFRKMKDKMQNNDDEGGEE